MPIFYSVHVHILKIIIKFWRILLSKNSFLKLGKKLISNALEKDWYAVHTLFGVCSVAGTLSNLECRDDTAIWSLAKKDKKSNVGFYAAVVL